FANGRRNLRLAPTAEARLEVAGQIAADENALRIRPDAHTAGEIEVVAAIDAGGIDRRVAEPAHLGVDEVFASGQRIGVLPGPVQTAARLPWRCPSQREHVVHD